MAPALLATLAATAVVRLLVEPPGPGQFDSGVALIATPSVGPPDWWFC